MLYGLLIINYQNKAMKKKLEDYLHFYLPVKVELNNGGSKVYNRIAVAVGNMDNEYRYVTLRMGEGIKAFTNSILFSEPNRIKPILRPLSDMTEDECLKLCSIVSPTIFGDFRYKKWAVSIERIWDSTQKNYTVKREGDSHSFEVDCIDGDILLWDDGQMIDSPYMNFNYRFEYLKMGFDIFGLIEDNLAVNACKLKTGSIA